jgi:uncharacterized protein YegJ (DUF2314 family)
MKHARHAAAAILSVTLAVQTGCRRSGTTSGGVERDGEPPVVDVDPDDPGMKKAITDARASVSTFVRCLNDRGADQEYFSVKALFGGKDGEHMWLSDVSHKSGTFHGTIGNEPLRLKEPKLGDSVEVSQNEITDWLIIERGELRGGWSIRLIHDRLTPDKRSEFDASSQFKLTDQIMPDCGK